MSFLFYFQKDDGLIECIVCSFSTKKGSRGFNIHLGNSPLNCKNELSKFRTLVDVYSSDDESSQNNHVELA